MATVLEVRQETFNRRCRFALSKRRDMQVAMPEIFRDGRFRNMALKFNEVVKERDGEEKLLMLRELADFYKLNLEVR